MILQQHSSSNGSGGALNLTENRSETVVHTVHQSHFYTVEEKKKMGEIQS